MKLLNVTCLGILSLLVFLPTSSLRADWAAPVQLSATGNSASLGNVQVNATGNAISVWGEFNGTNSLIMGSRLPFGGSWSTPQVLSTVGYDSFNPSVAVNALGDAVAIWETYNGTNSVIYVATRPYNGTWGTPEALSDSAQNASSGKVAIDSTGNMVAVWQRFDGSNLIVQSSRCAYGGNWSTPLDLSQSGQDAFLATVSMNASGKTMAIWTRIDGANMIIQAAVRSSGGNWSTVTNLSSSGQDAIDPLVAINAAGNAAVAWARSDGTNFIIQSLNYDFNGGWSSITDLSATGGDAFVTGLDIDSNGNAIAAWMRCDGSNFIIQSAVQPANSSWESPTDLSATGQDALEVTVGYDNGGNAVASWTRFDGSNYIIEAAALPAGDTWRATVDLSPVGYDSLFPQIAMDPSGNGVIVWMQNTGTYEVYSSSGTNLSQ